MSPVEDVAPFDRPELRSVAQGDLECDPAASEPDNKNDLLVNQRLNEQRCVHARGVT